MAVLTIRMPDTKADRLKTLAAQRDISLNKLMEELATYAIAEHDVENRFRIRAARGSAERGKSLLAELDRHYGTAGPERTPSYGLHEPEQSAYDPEPAAKKGRGRKKK